jgi:uncharacterized lipoprotein YmbA
VSLSPRLPVPSVRDRMAAVFSDARLRASLRWRVSHAVFFFPRASVKNGLWRVVSIRVRRFHGRHKARVSARGDWITHG